MLRTVEDGCLEQRLDWPMTRGQVQPFESSDSVRYFEREPGELVISLTIATSAPAKCAVTGSEYCLPWSIALQGAGAVCAAVFASPSHCSATLNEASPLTRLHLTKCKQNGSCTDQLNELLLLVTNCIMIHNNEIVSIEEVLIKPQQQQNYFQYLTRKFIFANRSTNLKLRVTSLGATIDSCKINDHQIIVPNNNEENNHTTPLWNESHVFGFDTLSLSFKDTPQKYILYQLTKNNEFIIEGKGFNSILPNFLMNPCYLNLNSVEGKPSLEGHYLRIRSSDARINVFTDSDAVFSQFINDIPLLINDYLEGSDFVYSTSINPSQIPNSCIIASLSYDGKSVDISLEVEQWTSSHLRVQIRNGSIAFIPHNMSRFKVTYKFNW